jgi:hypothetical protein
MVLWRREKGQPATGGMEKEDGDVDVDVKAENGDTCRK